MSDQNTTPIRIRLDRIVIGDRLRPLDRGKVEDLAASMDRIGLLNPITVTGDYTLVASRHRLEAARRLDWTHISAIFLAVDDPLTAELAEIDENLIRNELTILEQGEHLARREEILRALGQRAPDHRPRKGDNVTPFLTTATLADQVGIGERSAQRRLRVARALEPAIRDAIRTTPVAHNQTELIRLSKLPVDQQRIVAEKIAGGAAANVGQAAKQVVAEAIRSEPPPLPTGPFRVIVADPPWPYEKRPEDPTHRARLPYPEMTLDAIRALPVADLAAEDAILWLWTTNAHMEEAYTVVRAWGFERKTILTWAKDRMGTGDWLRGQTEHCLMAVKGKPTVLLTNQTTLLTGAVRDHSRKPESFYALVEELCPGSKVELFARAARPGWTVWGAEAGAAA